MNSNLLQATIEVVFMGHMMYVAPFLLLMMSVLFIDRIVDFIKTVVANKRTGY
ncbi:hypothetical protein [Gracilibacillus salitolerans]|uniref:hypothetical protein n=1 Tax=Gracilibacillus salitolerans TaxID=2663022 RepID=UPI001890EFBF|nr:hypothetical protein [Gracilibacillus salitolerans]